MTVDTLEIARKLEAAGMDKRQAEALAESMRDAVAGKDDLDQAGAGLKVDLDHATTRIESKLDAAAARLEGRIDTKVAELRAEVFRLMIGQIAIFSAIVALLRFLPIR